MGCMAATAGRMGGVNEGTGGDALGMGPRNRGVGPAEAMMWSRGGAVTGLDTLPPAAAR